MGSGCFFLDIDVLRDRSQPMPRQQQPHNLLKGMTMNIRIQIDLLRERYYAGRIGQSSFYRRVAALILMNERRRVLHLR